MVIIQKRFAYKYKNKEHFKYQIVIPQDIIEQLGWKEGKDVELSVENKKLILKSSKLGKMNEN
ncbi:MAG: AbrB/MazE/SpoVT family DNA-binding domain-containing protein [Candidatus Nitrosotenuis sp.]